MTPVDDLAGVDVTNDSKQDEPVKALVEFLNARLDEQEADGRRLDYLQTGEFLIADAASKRALIKWAIGYMEGDYAPWNELALRIMTHPYHDHADFRPEWLEVEA